ncbi:MAG: hypothetical protein ACRDD1_10905, partial [Planctomycetia bacterium]
MLVRNWFAAAVVAVSSAAGALAAEAVTPAAKHTAYSFSALRAVPADAAKAKLETWLKDSGKFDADVFAATWADESRSVLDRTADTIVRALPAAAAALSDAARPDAPAPTAIPAALTDDHLDPFVRSNLSAAYVKALAGRRVYEESLDAAKAVQVEQLVDPAGFLFFKAVAEHALIQRDAATSSIVRLLDDVADAPDRYKMVATLMFFDIQGWPKDEKDLANIGKLMDNSGRRLDLARAGKTTQDIQKKIVFRLDEKIKELEQQAKECSKCNGGQCPGGSKPGSGGGANPSAP